MRPQTTEITRRRVRRIQELAGEGMTMREIAPELGISASRVRDLSTRFNLLQPRPQTRRMAFYCSAKHAAVVMALAEQAKVSPSVMIERIVRSLVSDGLAHARKRLGADALPNAPKAAQKRNADPDKPERDGGAIRGRA